MINDRYPFFVVLSAVLCVACAPEPMTEAEAMAEANCTESNTLCVNLLVPDSYAGEASRLATAFYDSDNVNRPPDEVMPEILSPTVVPGEAYELSHTQMEVVGEYYLMFVLYDINGGTWSPEPGLDYTAMTEQPIVFDGTPVNLGDLVFEMGE